MAVKMSPDYDFSVFINCPFDTRYRRLFHAVIFTVYDCGYIARCAQENVNSGEVRLRKILNIIKQCRVGIHDISRTERDPKTRLPRFNMPLELGLFLGASEFGPPEQRKKVCLVLDKDRYRFHKFISDIGGQDPAAHEGKPEVAVRVVRDFLREQQPQVPMPGFAEIHRRYVKFQKELPALCAAARLKRSHMVFGDYTNLVLEWLAAHSKS